MMIQAKLSGSSALVSSNRVAARPSLRLTPGNLTRQSVVTRTYQKDPNNPYTAGSTGNTSPFTGAAIPVTPTTTGGGSGGSSGGNPPPPPPRKTDSSGPSGSDGEGGWYSEPRNWLYIGLAVALGIPLVKFLKEKFGKDPYDKELEKAKDHAEKATDEAKTGVKGKLGKAYHAVADTTAGAAHKVGDKLAAGKDAVVGKAEDAKDAVTGAASSAKHKVEDASSKVKSDVQHAKHEAEKAKAKHDAEKEAEAKRKEVEKAAKHAKHEAEKKAKAIKGAASDAADSAKDKTEGVIGSLKGAYDSVAHKVGSLGHDKVDDARNVAGKKLHQAGDKVETKDKRKWAAAYTTTGVLVGTGVLAGVYYISQRSGKPVDKAVSDAVADGVKKVKAAGQQVKDSIQGKAHETKGAANDTSSGVTKA